MRAAICWCGQVGFLVFVNIGRRDGVIEETHSDHVKVKTQRGDIHSVEFSDRLEVIREDDESPIPGHVGALSLGTPIGSVGVRLRNGKYRATRIWV